MPHFYRNSRQLLRLFLILVIGMGWFGWWYAGRNWQMEMETLQLSALTGEVDWLEFIAVLVEGGIEIFQGATGRS